MSRKFKQKVDLNFFTEETKSSLKQLESAFEIISDGLSEKEEKFFKSSADSLKSLLADIEKVNNKAIPINLFRDMVNQLSSVRKSIGDHLSAGSKSFAESLHDDEVNKKIEEIVKTEEEITKNKLIQKK